MAKLNKSNEDKLTHKLLTSWLRYDSETGIFTWAVNRNSRARKGDVAGRFNNRGYCQIMLNDTAYYAHRLAWFYIYMEWPTEKLDHIDQNTSNNSINNLRLSSQSNNMRNTQQPFRPSYGIIRHGRNYAIRFRKENKTHSFGSFPSLAVAQVYRDELMLKLGWWDHVVGLRSFIELRAIKADSVYAEPFCGAKSNV